MVFLLVKATNAMAVSSLPVRRVDLSESALAAGRLKWDRRMVRRRSWGQRKEGDGGTAARAGRHRGRVVGQG